MDIPERLETERLILRAYQAGDGPVLFEAGARNRTHLAKFESGNVLMHLTDPDHAESVAQELASDWAARACFFIGIFEKTTGAWAGQVYVGPIDWGVPAFTIGYVADVNHEGKGYISEAVKAVLAMLFSDLKAHRVTSDCNEHNVRSWRLLERCGFRREGHLRENRRNADGSFHGDFLYGLLREEFDAMANSKPPEPPLSVLSLALAEPSDAEILAQISKRAFDSDVAVGAPGIGGPPGYDSPAWQVEMMGSASYFKFLVADEIVGGAIVFPGQRGRIYLGRVFLDPRLHGQGVGLAAMGLLFDHFPEARKWVLETPSWNIRTRNFYLKVGFQLIKETDEDLFFEKHHP